MPIKREIKSDEIAAYDLDFICPDGDSVSLIINPAEEEIHIDPFSGALMSRITIHAADFTRSIADDPLTGDIEQDGLNIANTICRRLGLESYEWKIKGAKANDNDQPTEPVIAMPVRYIGDEDAFIYDTNNEILVDLDSLSDGTHGEDSHPGIREFHKYRDSVGEYIVKVLNEYPAQSARIAELEAEKDKLREALSHYVWEGNWDRDGYGNRTKWQVSGHGWVIAREALAQASEDK